MTYTLLNYLKNGLTIVLISIFYSSLVSAQASISSDYKIWKQTQNKEKITSYLGSTKVKGATPTKVKMTIEVTPKEVVEAITNFDKYHLWIPYCTKSNFVEKINKNENYAYLYIDAPMVSDRDVYIFSTIIKKSENSYEVIIEDKADYKPEKKGVVRIPHLYSHYYISGNDNGSTQVTHFSETALGGSIPDFLIDWSNKSQPFETTKTLREGIINNKFKK